MDKLAASGLGQIAVPLIIGLGAAASRPLARGLHGALTGMNVMNKWSAKSREEQRLKDLGAIASGIDWAHPTSRGISALMSNPATASTFNASLAATMAAQPPKRSWKNVGGYLLDVPSPGEGEPEVKFSAEEAGKGLRLKEFSKKQEIQDKYATGRMRLQSELNQNYFMKQRQILDQFEQLKAKRQLTPREAMKFMVTVQTIAKTEQQSIMTNTNLSANQMDAALKRVQDDLKQWNDILKPLMHQILPSEHDTGLNRIPSGGLNLTR